MFLSRLARPTLRAARGAYTRNVHMQTNRAASSFHNGARWSLAAIAAGGIGGAMLFGAAAQAEDVPAAAPVALSKKEWRAFKLKESAYISDNTKMLRFELPSPMHQMGISVASCLTVKAPCGEDGKDLTRPYTPVSLNGQTGYLELIVKEYPPPGGLMSRHINSLKPGDTLEFKGPWQKFKYEANSKKAIAMICGGTGITPMLQVVREILGNPADKTEVSMIFGNVQEKDILLRAELDALQYLHSNFTVHYTLDKPPRSGWTGSKGFVTADMVKEHAPAPGDDTMVLVCGPTPMVNAVAGPKEDKRKQGPIGGVLKDVGFTSEQVFKF